MCVLWQSNLDNSLCKVYDLDHVPKYPYFPKFLVPLPSPHSRAAMFEGNRDDIEDVWK
jgi:hypothetical protein